MTEHPAEKPTKDFLMQEVEKYLKNEYRQDPDRFQSIKREMIRYEMILSFINITANEFAELKALINECACASGYCVALYLSKRALNISHKEAVDFIHTTL